MSISNSVLSANYISFYHVIESLRYKQTLYTTKLGLFQQQSAQEIVFKQY